MFNELELIQKEKAFNWCKQKFDDFDKFYTGKSNILSDKFPDYFYTFATLSRFINYKEEIWVKNKKTKNITTYFSKEILDDFLFKGKFKPTKIHFTEERKRKIDYFDPIEISQILEGKEKDSVWIIDNIRDSLAHGHFYIDFDNKKIFIKNNHNDRLLHCSICLKMFYLLNELITEERIGGYSEKKLTTIPVLIRNQPLNLSAFEPIKNEAQLRNVIKNELIVLYCKVLNIHENDINTKYDDLLEFYNFNVKFLEKATKKHNYKLNSPIISEYEKTMKSYINNKMKNYDINIYNGNIDTSIAETVIKYIKDYPCFYEKKLYDQGIIIHETLKAVLSNENITLEQGVMDFIELYSQLGLKATETNEKTLNDLNVLIDTKIFSFKENKKLANLFILAINNFVCNKESIYDSYFDDYSKFNIENFDYRDYSNYNKIIKKLKIIENDINIANNSINKAQLSLVKANTNILLAPNDKKTLIQGKINSLNSLINDLQAKKSTLELEKIELLNLLNLHKTDDNGNYINNNKGFFNHIRNALAHNRIKYLDDTVVYNRKIILEDYDEDNNLTFKCIGRYYDFVKLFNSDLFLEAIQNYNNTKSNNKIKILNKKTSN